MVGCFLTVFCDLTKNYSPFTFHQKNMLHLLEYSHFNLALAFVAQSLGTDVLTTIQTRTLPAKKITLENWGDLLIHLSNSDDIFGNSDEALFVDCAALSLSQPSKEFWSQAIQSPIQIFLYSSENPIYKATDKKVLKSAKAQFHLFKKLDATVAANLANTHGAAQNLPLQVIAQIIQKAQHYDEIIDAIDFLALTPDPQDALSIVFPSEETQLFVRPFRPDTHSQDFLHWINIDENEIQLAEALVGGKLHKAGNNKLLSELIATDIRMKESAKLPAKTWWKLFVWKAFLGSE